MRSAANKFRLFVLIILDIYILQNTDGEIKVAIKKMPDNATMDIEKAFLEEIKMSKNLGYHPNIVTLVKI